jgi:hypothetical protein
MTEAEIQAVVDALGGLLGLLRDADARDRAEIYSRVGLQMRYRRAPRPCSRKLYREISIMYLCGVRGSTRTDSQRGPLLSGAIQLVESVRCAVIGRVVGSGGSAASAARRGPQELDDVLADLVADVLADPEELLRLAEGDFRPKISRNRSAGRRRSASGHRATSARANASAPGPSGK